MNDSTKPADELDWDKAEEYLSDMLYAYENLLRRFYAGERTQDLYDAMLGVV